MVTSLQWIGGAILVITFLVCLGLCISLFYKLLLNPPREDKTATGHKVIAMIGLICYVFTIMFFFIEEIFYFNDYGIGYPYVVVSFTWGTGNTFTNISFMIRIHDIFHKTVYKSSLLVYIILISFIILCWLSQGICTSLIEAFLTCNVLTSEL